MAATPQDVLDDLKGVFKDKNADYGNSWEKIGAIKRVMADTEGPQTITISEMNIEGRIISGDNKGMKRVVFYVSEDTFEDTDEIEFVRLADTPQKQSTFEENVDDLITRLLDKIIRVYTLTFLKDEPDVENESLADAAEDATGYCSMLASLIRRQ